MGYSSKSNILDNIMMLLKEQQIYKEFQCNATGAPKAWLHTRFTWGAF